MVEVKIPPEHDADSMFLPPVRDVTSLLDFSAQFSSELQLLFDSFAVSDEKDRC